MRPGLTVHPFLRFALVGCANTAIGYGAILFFQYVVDSGHLIANALGYAAGGITSYFLNKRFTFSSKQAHRHALPRFAAAAAGCYLLNLAVLEIGVSRLRLPAALAQGMAVIAYTVSFYLLSRRLVFGDRRGGHHAHHRH